MSLDMVCTCQVEGIRAVEEMRAEAAARLGVPPAKLIEAVVMSLAFTYGADAKVYADQWMGVSVEIKDRSLYIECDWLADGILRIWLEIEREGAPAVPPHALPEDSTKLLGKLDTAMQARAAHREAHSETHSATVRCQTCDALLDEYMADHKALDQLWGAEVLDPAIAAAYAALDRAIEAARREDEEEMNREAEATAPQEGAT